MNRVILIFFFRILCSAHDLGVLPPQPTMIPKNPKADSKKDEQR